MNDDVPLSQPKNWFERLSHTFSRDPQNREELLHILRETAAKGVINADIEAMFEGVMSVYDMQVRDIMIPRSQMVMVAENTTPAEFIPIVKQTHHSRFPVIAENREQILGILLAKDLIGLDLNTTTFDIRELLRPAIFIPESKRLDILLKEFRINHQHMAVVIDEYGGIAGLVTIEDVLEQIVGDIEDEHDIDAENSIKAHADGSCIVKAQTPIDDFNQYFHSHLNATDFDTIGGLVTHSFGHLPKRNDRIRIGDFHFTVLQADNRRIRLLQAHKTQTP